MRKLFLEDLEKEIPEISPAFRSIMKEAAQYCLNFFGHKPGVTLIVRGIFEEEIQLFWDKTTISNAEKKTWSDTKEAARYAAKAISILLIKILTDYNHFERLYQGLGVDFFISNNENPVSDKRLARLEISGIFQETKKKTVNIRQKIKKKQVKKSDYLGISVYIVVVELGTPKANIFKK